MDSSSKRPTVSASTKRPERCSRPRDARWPCRSGFRWTTGRSTCTQGGASNTTARVGRSLGRDAATGRGALICLDRIAHQRGWTREKIRIAVEGYGNAGSWFAQIAHSMGYKVVAVSDSKGAIINPEGLIPHEVLGHKHRTGSVIGYKYADDIDGPDLMGVECDVL